MLLSVDWDFFIWNGREANDPTFRADTGVEHPSNQFFRWIQNEKTARFPQLVEWTRRVEEARKGGIDLQQEMSIRPDRGCTPVAEFMEQLHRRCWLREAPLLYADSHRTGLWAARIARRRLGRPVEVLHFDAHADLGYNDDWMSSKPPGSFDCADWLHEAIREGLVSRARLVYPDWRKFQEWDALQRLKCVQQVRPVVEAMTWSQWRQLAGSPLPINVINFVRSSTWTPPWMDRGFLNMLPLFDCAGRMCMDADPQAYGSGSLPSSQRPRPWTR